jgi:hypothetical protein
MPPLHQRDDILFKVKYLSTQTIKLSFASQISWDLDKLTREVVDWLNGKQDSETSKVGLLSSPDFISLVQSFTGPQASLEFQRMLYAQSLAYTQHTSLHKHNLSITELEQIAGHAGHNFLMELDSKLRPTVLSGLSRDELLSLFLLIFGTILAVGYASPVKESPIFPADDVSNSVILYRISY